MTDQPPFQPARDDVPEPSTDPAPLHGVPGGDTETVSYSPPPEPRSAWTHDTWPLPAPAPGPTPTAPEPTPAGFHEPEPVVPVPVAPVQPTGPVGPVRPRGGAGWGQILAAAALSAVLASGGTVLFLQGSGALDRPTPTPAGAPGPAQTSNPVPIEDPSGVVEAAAKVSPAVVRITAEGVSENVFGGSIPERGIGSGVIYDASGWILTNRHVVQTQDGSLASSLTVELKDGREFTGTVYGVDTLTDLAIVKVDASGLPAAATGRSASIRVGQLAIAIGSPLGTYTSTVTTGIVSATGRSVEVETGVRLNNLIQTDAAINPGNSGGPLLDAAGAVIGINTAVERDSTGIGFAIPIDIARPIMDQALAGVELARPYLGIRYQAINLKLKNDENLSVDHGALIGPASDPTGETQPAITPGSPAEQAGLKDGDIILNIGDQAVDAEHPLDAILTSFAPGDAVQLTVLRGGNEVEVTVTLGTRPDGL